MKTLWAWGREQQWSMRAASRNAGRILHSKRRLVRKDLLGQRTAKDLRCLCHLSVPAAALPGTPAGQFPNHKEEISNRGKTGKEVQKPRVQRWELELRKAATGKMYRKQIKRVVDLSEGIGGQQSINKKGVTELSILCPPSLSGSQRYLIHR